MRGIYSTKDFYCTALLICQGFELAGHYREGSVTLFQFNKSRELMEIVKKYYEMKVLIEPMKFGQSIRALKGILHNASLSESNANGDLINGKFNKTRGKKCNA